MFWYVDNGSWNWMNNNWQKNTKQAEINFDNWTWHTSNDSYTITVVAVSHQNGYHSYGSVTVHDGASPAAGAPTSVPTPILVQPAPTPAATITTQSAMTEPLYINPNNDAAQTAATTNDTTMKRVMTRLASTPTAIWFGSWNSDITNDASAVVSAASAAKQLPVLVAYNIVNRDCGGYSSGGAQSAGSYETWISNFATGIGNRNALVVLEPDALGEITCLSNADQSTRYQLLDYAVHALKANPNTRVYIDAGNPPWVPTSEMATRLQSAGIAQADGFSLNVSNFVTTNDNIAYGNQISHLVGGKHFVIDTSRNGNGPNGDWCNPTGRALGTTPTTNTGDQLADYFLYIKMPGESDGTCNGGPAAGVWWPDYAKNLALNAGW